MPQEIEDKVEVLIELPGQLQAELLHSMLEAEEVQAFLSQEGIGHVYALTFGSLGAVQVLVRSSQLAQARQILEAFEPVLEQNEEPAESNGEETEAEE